MTIEWTDSLENVTWEELSNLYQIAPLGKKDADDLKVAFGNSMFKWFAYENGILIAAGRALADGRDCSYICDVAVHPEIQGQGLGKEVVSRLVGQSRNHKKILLYAAKGKEPFYLKLGFKRMTTAMAIFKDETQALQNGVITDEA